MAHLLIGGLLIDAALLGLLVYVFARYNATNDLFNRVAVVAAATIGNLILAALWGTTLGLGVLIPQALLTSVLLIWLIGTNPVQAAIITGLFYVIKIAGNIAWAYVVSDL